jgi:hypothetical protein
MIVLSKYIYIVPHFYISLLHKPRALEVASEDNVLARVEHHKNLLGVGGLGDVGVDLTLRVPHLAGKELHEVLVRGFHALVKAKAFGVLRVRSGEAVVAHPGHTERHERELLFKQIVLGRRLACTQIMHAH